MSVIIKESGWYRQTDDDGYIYIGEDADELAKALDDSGDLDSVVKEYVNDNYCLEDIIQEILDDCTRYTCREDVINEWIQNVEHGTIYLWEGDVTYFDEGEEADADYVIGSVGERIEYVEDDEEDDEEEEDDTD